MVYCTLNVHGHTVSVQLKKLVTAQNFVVHGTKIVPTLNTPVTIATKYKGMQLAGPRCQWCDFVVYTFKDITIDGSYFDEDFWMHALVKPEEFMYILCVAYVCSLCWPMGDIQDVSMKSNDQFIRGS